MAESEGRKFRWTKGLIKHYCHGDNPKERKNNSRHGCAPFWEIWPVLGYYYDKMALIKSGMPHPGHWEENDWRMAHEVFNQIERLAQEDALEDQRNSR